MGGSKGGRGGSGSGKEKKKTTSARRTGGVQTANKPFVGFSAFAVKPDDPEATQSSSAAASAASTAVAAANAGGGGGGVARPSPVYAGTNRRLTALFQKLRKKDPVTKTKALESLRRYAFPTPSDVAVSTTASATTTTEEEESGEGGGDGPTEDGEGEGEEEKLIKYDVILALNHFAFLFHNPHTPPSTCLALDNDHRVRAGALGCWAGAVRTVPRAARSLLLHGSSSAGASTAGRGGGTNILGAIWCLCSDPVREVSTAAASAVRAVMDGGDCLPVVNPGGNVGDDENSVLVRDAVISHLNATLPSTRRRTKSDGDGDGRGARGGGADGKGKKGGKDEVGGGGGEDEGEEDERYERTIVSALDGASKLLARFREENTRRGDDDDGTEDEIGFTYGRSFAEGVPWKHVASQRGSFRRGTYNLVSSASQHAPSVLIDHPSIRPSLVTAFSSERDPANFPPLFEALLLYLSAAVVPEGDEDGDSGEWYRRLCGAVGKQLRRACCGSPAAQWCPLLLPLLARLPATKVAEAVSANAAVASTSKGVDEVASPPDGGSPTSSSHAATNCCLRLHCQVLTSLWEGRKAAVSTLDQIAIATAVSEGAAFLLLRRRAEAALSKKRTTDSSECNQGVREAEDWLGDEAGACALIDLFIATLRWYMEENAVVPPTSGRENHVVDLVTRQARELHRIDESWQSKEKQDSLLLKYGEHFWVNLRGVPGFGTGDANDGSAELQLGEPHVKKLLFLLQGITDQSQPQIEGERALWRERDEALFEVATTEGESLLVSSVGRNFRFILDACKKRGVSLPTRNELHLLATLVAFCGVFRLFCDDVDASCDAVSTALRTADGGGVVVADRVAASVEKFSMNDLLRWTVILGSSNSPNVSTIRPSVDSRDSMIRLCFVLLRQCLEVLTTRRQKQLWEAFLRELIEGRCHLGVLAIGLSVLSSPVRQSRQSPLDEIIRCGTLEKLAVEVGIAAEDLRIAALEELDVPPSVIEIDGHEDRESFAHYESELSSFLQVCAGLASNSSNLLVGPNVIRKWIDSCVNVKYNVHTGQQGASDGLVSGNNMLLETLIALALEKTTTVDEGDSVSLAIEGWCRGGTVWTQECHALLLGSTSTTLDESNVGKDASATIRKRFCTAASDSLKSDLTTTQNCLLRNGFMDVASKQWAQRAQRLISLGETTAIQNQNGRVKSAGGNLSQNLVNPLACIGLGDGQAWKDMRSISTPKDGTRHGVLWMWSCLTSFLDVVGDIDDKRMILLGDRTERDAALFVEILLSSIMVSQVPSFSLNKSEAGRDLIAAVGGREGLGDEFIFLCCEVVVKLVLDAMILHDDDIGKSPDICDSQADKLKTIGSGVQILDLLASCVLAKAHANNRLTSSGNRPTDEMHGGDSVQPAEVKEGDVLWYVADENEENAPRKRVTVVKIHSDDFPNLYFTVVENGSNKERQTVTSRLRKHDKLLYPVELNKPSSERFVGGVELSVETSKWALRLENLIVNDLVKPIFDFLPSAPPIMEEPCIQHIAEAAYEALNIVISRCRLTGGVGVGSVRYEVFQLVKTIEEQLVKTAKARTFRSIDCESGGGDKTTNTTKGDKKQKAPEERICCESAFVCFSLAMAGGRYTERSSANFDVLRYDPCDSISVVFELYEDPEWFNSHPLTENCDVLDIHSASLMWSAAVAGSLHDEPSLGRLACTMNEIIHLVLASVKQKRDELEGHVERTLLVMRAVCALHDQQRSLDIASNLSLPSLSELVWCFVHLWYDRGLNRCGNKLESPPWHDLFLTVLQSVDEREVFLRGAKKHVDAICGTLFCPGKRWFGYQLLNMIAATGFAQETQLSPPIHSHLDSWVESIPVEEAEELKEDVQIACGCVPRALLEDVCTWSDGGTGMEHGETSVSGADGADAHMGKLLLWLSILDFLEKSASADARSRGAVISYIQQTNGGRFVLDTALQCSPLVEWRGKSASNSTRWLSCTDFKGSSSDMTLPNVAMLVIFRTVQALPTLVKSWWNDDCHKATRSAFKQFVQNEVGPETLRIEIERIKSAQMLGDMIVNGSCISREVMATYIQDECKLSVLIRVPDSFPLRNVEVDCHKTLGVPEKRWRRWALQIMMMLNNQDGSILDALMLWKENVDKEFDGVEPCPVCYSVLCVKTHAMPNLECKTCNNRFHVSCLYKWFHSSGKSQCVLCQQPWSGARV